MLTATTRDRACYRCLAVLPGAAVFCVDCGTPVPTLIPAHPGAGVTTVAAVTGFTDSIEPARVAGHVAAVRVLVARTHAAGLAYLRDAIRESPAPPARVLLVPDAPGPLPKPLADQVRIISGVAQVSQIPWVKSWRYAPAAEIPKPVDVFLSRLRRDLTDHVLTIAPHTPAPREGATP